MFYYFFFVFKFCRWMVVWLCVSRETIYYSQCTDTIIWFSWLWCYVVAGMMYQKYYRPIYWVIWEWQKNTATHKFYFPILLCAGWEKFCVAERMKILCSVLILQLWGIWCGGIAACFGWWHFDCIMVAPRDPCRTVNLSWNCSLGCFMVF